MLYDLIDVLYLRLSKEDGDVASGTEEESCSISSQRTCIHRYLRDHHMDPDSFEEIVDDGYSGTSLHRPGMSRLIKLVEQGRVRSIVVRDLSRFSRNYLEAGHYLEFVFPTYGVRFISINDQFDSDAVGESTGGLELAIRNLINQMYSRDISKKIKSAVDIKKLNGEFVYGTAPYGYKKGPTRNTIVIDEPAAIIVKKIFLWASTGESCSDMAKRLNTEGVLTPSVFLAAIRGKYKTRSVWTYESVRNILLNRIYTGDTIPFKSHVVRVGSDRTKAIPEDQQIVIPNTHEAIVSRELFFQARNAQKRYAPRTADPNRQPYLFTSLLVCGCCGNRLIRGKVQNKEWRCTTHRYDPEAACKDVRFNDEKLAGIVLRAIQTQSKLLDAKVKRLRINSRFTKTTEEVVQSECQSLRKEMDKIYAEKMEAYEKYVAKTISKEEFLAIKASYATREQSVTAQLNFAEAKLANLTEQLKMDAHHIASSKPLIDYQEIEMLDPDILKELVERICIYPDGRIKIIWNFSDEVSELLNQNLAPAQEAAG